MMIILASLSLIVWGYMLLFHDRFWHCDQRLRENDVTPSTFPAVSVVIPARDEADTIERTVRSILEQDYPGDLEVVVVDDGSQDGTGDIVRRIEDDRVTVIHGEPLPDEWSGKMWAVHQGIQRVNIGEYVLLTDADIDHDKDNLIRLVAKAQREDVALVSLMVRLHCASVWERLLIPPFIYFFQQLFPFPAVNDPKNKVAAAAGGCMLVERSSLNEVGGVYEIRNKIIDDCALANLIKPNAPIWLGLGESAKSTRAYEELAPIWKMVARTAYVQLNYNPVYLFGTVLGMILLYLVPPMIAVGGFLVGEAAAASVSAIAYVVMVWTMLPTLDYYRLSPVWALVLPIAGMIYAAMTLDSARLHYLQRGSSWKNRTYQRGQ